MLPLLQCDGPALAAPAEYPSALNSRDLDAAGAAARPGLFDSQWWPREPPEQRTRDALEWALLGLLAARVYGERARVAVAVRLDLLPPPGRELEGSRLRLSLDVGRERGTWMPPQWGLSGRRLLFDVAVELGAGGVARPLAVGAFVQVRFGEGRWSVEGDALRLQLPMLSPLERGDLSLVAQSLFFKTRVWGGVVGRRGNLLVQQTRWLLRREMRTVGVFTCEPLSPEELPEKALAAAVVRQRFTE